MVINQMSNEINTIIVKADNQLDELNKKNKEQVDNLKEGNYALVETIEITQKRNTSMMCWVGFILALSIVIGITVYFQFF